MIVFFFFSFFGIDSGMQITDGTLVFDIQTVNVGKRLALLKGVLKREKDGAIISTCEHQMYNVDADAAAAKL